MNELTRNLKPVNGVNKETDIIINQDSELIQQYLGKGKVPLLIYNDNRGAVFQGNIATATWQDLLEACLYKAPQPREKMIRKEMMDLALRNFNTKKAAADFLGVGRTAFMERLRKFE
jgi:glutaredoxin 2